MSLKTFTDAYIECALWSSNDDRGEGGDSALGRSMDASYGPEDFAPATREQIEKDCRAFYENHALWADELSDVEAGHDFWMTRNHHGSGFWDRPGFANGKALTDAAHVFGEFTIYVGDDGKVHA